MAPRDEAPADLAEVARRITPRLWTWASGGALAMPERAFPPPARIWEGVDSHLGVPIANLLGYRTLRIDLHLPVRGPSERPLPVVLYASGGAWKLVAPHHGPWRALLDHGYAVAVVEYRPSAEARFPAGLHDVKAAIRWLRAAATSLSLDPARIAGWGSSAGAHLMNLAALTTGPPYDGEIGESLDTSSELACVISHYAPTDLSHLAADTNHLAGVVERAGTAESPEALLLGASVDERPDLAELASPVTHAVAGSPPFLILHGTDDVRVGPRQAQRLHQALTAAGAHAELHLIEGAGHIDAAFVDARSEALALDFLRRWLRD